MKMLLFLLLWCACSDTSCFAQTIMDSCHYYMPNTLTPDCEEGDCPVPEILATCPFREFSFTIFNRWGTVIFETDKPEKQFDCTHEAEGTYYRKLKATFANSQKVDDTGYVTILK